MEKLVTGRDGNVARVNDRGRASVRRLQYCPEPSRCVGQYASFSKGNSCVLSYFCACDKSKEET